MAHKCLIKQASIVFLQQMPTLNTWDLVVKLIQQLGALAVNQLTTISLADPQRKLIWIGHLLKEDWSSITRQAFKRNPQGKGGMVDQGTPGEYRWKTRCPRRDTLAQMAQKRVRWRGIVSGMCFKSSKSIGLSDIIIIINRHKTV